MLDAQNPCRALEMVGMHELHGQWHLAADEGMYCCRWWSFPAGMPACAGDARAALRDAQSVERRSPVAKGCLWAVDASSYSLICVTLAGAGLCSLATFKGSTYFIIAHRCLRCCARYHKAVVAVVHYMASIKAGINRSKATTAWAICSWG